MHINFPKVVIGITQIDMNPWREIFENGQLPTWIDKYSQKVEVINLFGIKPTKSVYFLDQLHERLRWMPQTSGLVKRIDRVGSYYLQRKKIPVWQIEVQDNLKVFYSKVVSTYLTTIMREFSLFEYFINSTNSQFLYLTNTSSYINVDQLLEEVNKFPKTRIYGGTIMNFGGIKFASGANRIFSRDVVEFLINEFSNIDYTHLEDVAIGKLLEKYEFTSPIISSKSFSEASEILIQNRAELNHTAHFRLKSGSLKARNDSELMRLLHSRLVLQEEATSNYLAIHPIDCISSE